MSKRSLFLLSMALVILAIYVSSCGTGNTTYEGEKLAIRYCGSCHHVPNPASLTKKVWNKSIMPKMSQYYKWSERSRFHYANKSFYSQAGTIPMTDTIWSSLLSFFQEGALEDPTISNYSNLEIQSFFEEKTINVLDKGRGVTAVAVQGSSAYAGIDSTLYEINAQGELVNSQNTNGLISGIFPDGDREIWITDPGILDPHDVAIGSIKKLDTQSEVITVIKDSLVRPVYLNQFRNQFYISEFGNEKGAFSELNKNGQGYEALSDLPGSYKSFIFDYDKDGNDEILVMFAQALEGIYAKEIGMSSRRFSPILSFGPEWGISDVDTVDINRDGWTDLIIVNGDNADYSPIPKVYHGARIYLNNKEGRFEEAFSFPLHGTTQVQIIDANDDGFQDILIGAFFALEKSNSLILLMNNGDDGLLEFTPYTFTHADKGRWMVMNTGDIDADGDQDIIIGSFEHIDGIPSNTSTSGTTDLLLLLKK